MPFATVLRDDDLFVRHLPGTTDRLVVVFTGAMHKAGGVPMDEFVGSASDGARNHLMMVSELRRSWYSRAGVQDRVEDVVMSFAERHRIGWMAAVGNSMGGYGALLFGGRMPFQVVAAFSPQVSMNPDAIDERRWARRRAHFGPELPLNASAGLAGRDVEAFVSWGRDAPRDMAQADLLVRAPNVHQWRVRGAGHDLALKLKAAGLSRAVFDAKLARRPMRVRWHYARFEAPLWPGLVRARAGRALGARGLGRSGGRRA